MTIESALSDGGRPWLGGEVARSLVALGCGFVLAVATVAALLLVGGRIGGMGLALVVYAGYGAAYALLTDVVFRGRTAEQIGAALGKPSDVGWVHRWVLADVPGPGVAVFFAMVALGVAAWILPRSAQFAGRGSEGLLMAAGAGVVLAAWAMVVVTYALHYAHQDSGRAQLDFPVRPGAEAQPPSFGDYAYFSIAVSTTFGTTDVTVTSTRMRRTVMGHTLVAFVFATVILGLLVSLLVR